MSFFYSRESKHMQWTLSAMVSAKPDKFVTHEIDVQKLIGAWRHSIVSFEWLMDGQPKPEDALNDTVKERVVETKKALKDNVVQEQPMLGIGIFDGIEIGTGRALVYVLAQQGVASVKCSLPASMEKDILKMIGL